MGGQVDLILSGILAKRSRENMPVPEEMRRTSTYCKRFKALKNESNAAKAKETVLRKVRFLDMEGKERNAPRCRDFEAVQLLNLMPTSKEEAEKLIPTLAENPWLDQLIADIQPMREFDRALQ